MTMSPRLIGSFILLAFAGPVSAFERAPLPSEGAMEPCPAYGAGFARIPGTSTCIRVSGRVVAGADVGTSHHAPGTPPIGGRITVDARSASDYGPVRSFLRIGAGR